MQLYFKDTYGRKKRLVKVWWRTTVHLMGIPKALLRERDNHITAKHPFHLYSICWEANKIELSITQQITLMILFYSLLMNVMWYNFKSMTGDWMYECLLVYKSSIISRIISFVSSTYQSTYSSHVFMKAWNGCKKKIFHMSLRNALTSRRYW